MTKHRGISWTEETLNTGYGCSMKSAGCKFCYAMVRARSIESDPNPKRTHAYDGLTVIKNRRPVWTGETRISNDNARQLLAWKKPRLVFMNSMNDFFYEGFSEDYIFATLDIMQEANWHVIQVLTKRDERMVELLTAWMKSRGIEKLTHIWIGVTIEHQDTIGRLDNLMKIPADVHWISAEPLLGPLDFAGRELPEFIAVGGESMDWELSHEGFEAREFNPQWARDILTFFSANDKIVHIKQMGSNPVGLKLKAPKGDNIEEFPEDLRVRGFPPMPQPAQMALF